MNEHIVAVLGKQGACCKETGAAAERTQNELPHARIQEFCCCDGSNNSQAEGK